MTRDFPLRGVAGLISDSPQQIELAVRLGLSTVEVRADLLLVAGSSETELLDVVKRVRAQGLACLFTLRHPTHDGRFEGTEAERVRINRAALSAGAQIVDLEFGTEAARQMLGAGAPVCLSHHDFAGMPDAAALRRLTDAMEAQNPAAIKIVPTARSISDAARMLAWVGAARPDGPRRIGFAMGPEGACSRILTVAFGAPITYASFGPAVAPGQLPIAELFEIYRAHRLDAGTRVFGIAGNAALDSLSPFLHNPAFQARGINAVYVPFQTSDFADLVASLDVLRVDGMSVTNPFKADVLSVADEVDERSTSCGAANTVVVAREAEGRRIRAYNTDYDGVTIPIARHRNLDALKVAVIGNGGAARGAVGALLEVGAKPTLYYRNPQKGEPVARELGVPGASLQDIGNDQDVYLNATTLGSKPDDPSPVPADVFKTPSQIAFDMCYQQPTSRFLEDARAAGARLVRGGEMLVAQGTEQFRHFTGEGVSLLEFEENFEAAKRYR